MTPDNTELQSRIDPQSNQADYLCHVDLIVWEELPIANKAAVECTDQLLRKLMECSLPFGGKPIVGLGNFHQVAPVIKNGSRAAVFDASIHSSYLWPLFTILPLMQPIRNAMDPEFSDWVDQVG